MSVVCPHCELRHSITIAVTEGATRRAGLKWQTVDWEKSTKQLAQEMKVNPSLVSLWRRKLAPHTARREKIAAERAAKPKWWLSADWSKSDVEIARDHGKSRPTVFYHRQKQTQVFPPARA